MDNQNTNNNSNEAVEPVAVESPTTEITQIINEGDPDTQLAVLERKAELAVRFSKAMSTILLTQTYPEDWQEFDGKACLSSAGAERVARLFDIEFYDVKNKKEEFTDASGKGYRYVFEGKARMGNRVVYAQGVYGTRDKFLGFAKGEWRAVEDVNENHVRNAAYHIFVGNGVKGLLGLRNMPMERFQEIMSGVGENTNKTKTTSYAKGSQGGTSADDQQNQIDLSKILMDMANASQLIEVDDKGKYSVVVASEIADPILTAQASCKALTSFYSKKDKKIIDGLDSIKALKGKRLEIALNNAKTLQEKGVDDG